MSLKMVSFILVEIYFIQELSSKFFIFIDQKILLTACNAIFIFNFSF